MQSLQWQTNEELERQLGLRRSVHYAVIHDEQKPGYFVQHLKGVYELSEHAVIAAFMLRRQIYDGFFHEDIDGNSEFIHRNRIGRLHDASGKDMGWGYQFRHPTNENHFLHTVCIRPTFVYRDEPDLYFGPGRRSSPAPVNLSAYVERSWFHDPRSYSWDGRENA